jgi:hypothetical protein
MARKLNIPKSKQIVGLRKAIANRKTPRQFIPSLKKRLAKLTGAAVVLFALFGCAARPAIAQTPVSILPLQQILATNVSCTGSPQTFSPANKNQTQHYVTVTSSGATSLSAKIMGQDVNGNNVQISDVVFPPTTFSGSNVITGSGYFPKMVVIVTCTSGSFSLTYSGSQAISNVIAGSYFLSQVNKSLFISAPTNTSVGTPSFVVPFGSSSGKLYFQYNTAGIASSTLTVTCQSGGVLSPPNARTYTLANSTAVQIFQVPVFECPILQVSYVSGGASANTFNLDYVFTTPGFSSPNTYTHIAGTTATVVTSGSGVLHSVVVGTPAAGTITFFDLAAASCTGTPSTNVVSVITATTTFPAAPEIYDTLFVNGICVKASAAMDITVSSQ